MSATPEYTELANMLRDEVLNTHPDSSTRKGTLTITTRQAELLLPLVENAADYTRHGRGKVDA